MAWQRRKTSLIFSMKPKKRDCISSKTLVNQILSRLKKSLLNDRLNSRRTGSQFDDRLIFLRTLFLKNEETIRKSQAYRKLMEFFTEVELKIDASKSAEDARRRAKKTRLASSNFKVRNFDHTRIPPGSLCTCPGCGQFHLTNYETSDAGLIFFKLLYAAHQNIDLIYY